MKQAQLAEKVDISKAVKAVDIQDCYNVQEYFGALNDAMTNNFFLLNDKIVLSGSGSWISNIIKTNAIPPENINNVNDRDDMKTSENKYKGTNIHDVFYFYHPNSHKKGQCIKYAEWKIEINSDAPLIGSVKSVTMLKQDVNFFQQTSKPSYFKYDEETYVIQPTAIIPNAQEMFGGLFGGFGISTMKNKNQEKKETNYKENQEDSSSNIGGDNTVKIVIRYKIEDFIHKDDPQMLLRQMHPRPRQFTLDVEYSDRVTLLTLFDICQSVINNNQFIYPQKCYNIKKIDYTRYRYNNYKCPNFIQAKLESLKNKIIEKHSMLVNGYNNKITAFDRKDIESLGICLVLNATHRRRLKDNKHNEHGEALGNNINICGFGTKCAIYSNMKDKYQYTQSNYDHVSQFNHFEGRLDKKPACRYGTQCKAFCRLEKNLAYRFDDKCHLLLFRHPPRTRWCK